jgi:hypothetical protein
VTAPAVHRPSLNVRKKAEALFRAGKALLDPAANTQPGPDFVAGLVAGTAPWPYSVAWYAECWHCNCQARTFCAHMLAMQMVIVADVMATTGLSDAEVLAVPDPRWAELATTVPATAHATNARES